MALHWTSSSMSISYLYWGDQDWTKHCRYRLPGLSRGKESLSLPAGKALPNALQDWPTCETKAEKRIYFYATIRNIISYHQTLDQVNQEFKHAGSEANFSFSF